VRVSFDDGTAGQEGEYHKATVNVPVFDPLAMDVDWKVLPADLMYAILNLPYRTEQLESKIAQVWDFDDPPEYPETFWTRQHGFAVLGLEVSDLARKVRLYADLPTGTPVADETNRDDVLRKQRDKLSTKEEYERQCAAAHRSFDQVSLS
jgi:hypothetical protein